MQRLHQLVPQNKCKPVHQHFSILTIFFAFSRKLPQPVSIKHEFALRIQRKAVSGLAGERLQSLNRRAARAQGSPPPMKSGVSTTK